MPLKFKIFCLQALALLMSVSALGQVSGCTDPLANNFNQLATQNNGSCLYNPATASVTASWQLTDSLTETSGLIYWDNYLYTHNDDTDKKIYRLDTATGAKLQVFTLNAIKNKDWEEVSQDSDYIYLGDFGNNLGNRMDLKIYRINKNSLLLNSPVIDSIMFSYSDQVDFTPSNNNTNFDCEAFIVSSDSIYIFTKQWVNSSCGVYSLPKTAGTHTANLRYTLNVQGLITGATWLPSQKLIVLSGYSGFLQPFLFLLYDFEGRNFGSGNKRKVEVPLPFYQIEAVATRDGYKYYLSNEIFVNPPFSTSNKLHTLSLSSFLGTYLSGKDVSVSERPFQNESPRIFPNPGSNYFTLELNVPARVYIFDATGKAILTVSHAPPSSKINLSGFAKGLHFAKVQTAFGQETIKIVVH